MAASAPSLEYVQKMFLAYFGRPVAPTGQEYYGQVVDAGNIAALRTTSGIPPNRKPPSAI